MTMSAFTVAVLVAWPALNILLGGYAAWLALAGERRRQAKAAPPDGVTPRPAAAGPAAGGRPGEPAEADGSWWSSLWSEEPAGWGAGSPPEPVSPRSMASPDLVPASPAAFWIVVPCLNEERVVARTVGSALALAAPGAETYVLAVDDASDDRTPQVLAGIDNPRLHVLRRELPNARRGKGEALNAAYAHISGWAERAGLDPARVVLGVIDGDGRGSDNLLVEVAEALTEPRLGAVQARVRIHNRDKLLGAVQDLEFGCVADASQMVRARIGSVGLGGNGQFTRLSVLRDLGAEPWSDCLVEDLELGLRLHLAGVGIGYVWRACITQQGVVDVRRLLRQRTRWAQGNLQCVRYLPRLAVAPDIRTHTFLEMAYYLLAPWLNAFGSVAIAGLCGYAAYLLADGGLLVAGLPPALGVLVWLAALASPGLSWAVLHRLRLRDERLSRCLLAGLFYPALLLLGLVSTWRAVGRQVLGRHGWTKTDRLADEPLPVPAH